MQKLLSHSSQRNDKEHSHSYHRVFLFFVFISAFAFLILLPSLTLMSCNDRACRDQYVCEAGYLCNKQKSLCFSKCQTKAQCDTQLGYICQQGKCVCDKKNKNAYCHKRCYENKDCLALAECKGNKTTPNLCECKDPCQEEDAKRKALCLDKKKGAKPEKAPGYCFKTSNASSPEDDGGDSFGDAGGDSFDDDTTLTDDDATMTDDDTTMSDDDIILD